MIRYIRYGVQERQTYWTYRWSYRIAIGKPWDQGSIISFRPNPRKWSKVVKIRFFVIFRECVWVLKYRFSWVVDYYPWLLGENGRIWLFWKISCIVVYKPSNLIIKTVNRIEEYIKSRDSWVSHQFEGSKPWNEESSFIWILWSLDECYWG